MKEKCPYINLKNEFNSPKTMKKSFSSTYNYFQIESKNKKRSTNKYLGVKSIEENKSMNSDFITLSREANIYTSKDKYIKNKKIQLFYITPAKRANLFIIRTSFAACSGEVI